MNNVQTVQLIAQCCSHCGAGPWHPREEQSIDRYNNKMITEARWVCGKCGQFFASGVVSVKDMEPSRK